MDRNLFISFIISFVLHTLIISMSSLVPYWLGVGTLGFGSEKVDLVTELATEDDDNKINENEVIIDESTINIDIVSKSQLNVAFEPDLAKKLGIMLNLIEEERQEEKEKREEREREELEMAASGENIINVYPLEQHANVIIEHLDFSAPFDVELALKVNSDGSFRDIEILKTIGRNVVDESLKNILVELGAQKVAFFSNFRVINISITSNGTDSFIFKVTSTFSDSLNASSTHFLLRQVVRIAKDNNKNDKETMTFLNNLEITQNNNILVLTINSDPLFVKEAIIN